METQNLTDEEINGLVDGVIGAPLFVIRKPIHAPFDYYRENAAGYTTLAEAWRVTEEVGKRYISGRPSDSDRVILEKAPAPSYATSLDACATFEATIIEKVAQVDYAQEVVNIINSERHGEHRFLGASDFDRITATPRQRCIAFLRMKGAL